MAPEVMLAFVCDGSIWLRYDLYEEWAVLCEGLQPEDLDPRVIEERANRDSHHS